MSGESNENNNLEYFVYYLSEYLFDFKENDYLFGNKPKLFIDEKLNLKYKIFINAVD